MSKERYYNIDGLRTIGAIGIILMHVLVNGKYSLNNNYLVDIIQNMGHFVKLFFIISAFGMCCGYYDKIKNNSISLDLFYKKRFQRILPFFATLVFADFILSKGQSALYAVFADLTLTFGLLPNSDIQVIGVGWTLGVIFAFYFLFPFFVFTINTKKRAWITFAITLLLNFSCENYFLVNGQTVQCNFIRWAVYFVVGGIIYLYRNDIKRLCSNKIIFLFTTVLATCILFCSEYNHYDFTIKKIILFSFWLIYAITYKNKFLNNPTMRFLGSYSFEIYLSHMFVYRIAEKLGLIHITNNEWISYVIILLFVILGSIAYSVVWKKVYDLIVTKYMERNKIVSSNVPEF